MVNQLPVSHKLLPSLLNWGTLHTAWRCHFSVEESSQWVSQLPPVSSLLLRPRCARITQLSPEFPHLRELSDWWLGSALASVAKRRPHSGQLWLAVVQRNASSQSPPVDSGFQVGLAFIYFYLQGKQSHIRGCNLFPFCILLTWGDHLFLTPICKKVSSDNAFKLRWKRQFPKEKSKSIHL